MTEVENNELVAGTPGFSTFVIGSLEKEHLVVLIGRATLVPGERTTFIRTEGATGPRKSWLLGRAQGKWTAESGVSLVYTNNDYAIVQAGNQPGFARVTHECIDLANGRRWFGFRVVDIKADSKHLENGFSVSVVAVPWGTA